MPAVSTATEGVVTIKTYRGRTIAEALDALKKDLGREAVILNTRTFKAGGVFGFGARTIAEIVATTQQHAPQQPAAKPKRTATVKQTQAGTYAASNGGGGVLTRAPAPARPPESPPPVPPTSSIRDVAKLIVSAQAKTPLEEELASIKRMVGQVLRSAHGSRQPSMPDALFDCYRRLLEAEVAAEIAEEITSGVRDDLSASELNEPAVVQSAVLRRLSSFLPVASEAGRVQRAPDGRSLTIALVGPTGVGKTTTIAKLAATYKLRHGRKVGLITCDTYRIAAVDQLRTYADIIGLPLRVAMTPAEVRTSLLALSDMDVVLIDTAGRSPRDAERLGELRAMLDAADPHQRHLVLSSTASESALSETAAAFAPLGYDRVILTKLDEAVNFGVLVNVVRRLQTKLSFVTTGQEVPEHLEPGNSDRLARCILTPEVRA